MSPRSRREPPPFVIVAATPGEDFHDMDAFSTFDQAHAQAKAIAATKRYTHLQIVRGKRVVARYAVTEEAS